ncbi:hypothetical protein [Micromonospora sp. SL4-19]|uniref:hypothetical protein n=1 Tax=Micromonospora sp. SL4-19 TaxID=3399129 RepID=UPI003A4D27DF
MPVVELPDGRRVGADEPAGHEAVSGRRITITREADVMHHDEGPMSLISTAAVRRLLGLLGEPVDLVRFRANLLIDVPGSDFAAMRCATSPCWKGRSACGAAAAGSGLSSQRQRKSRYGVSTGHPSHLDNQRRW